MSDCNCQCHHQYYYSGNNRTGYLLIEGSKIKAVGRDIPIPEGAR